MHARLDHAALADRRRSFDRDERIDDRVVADRDRRIDHDRRRIAERHALGHQLRDDAALDLAFDRRQIGARIDAERFDRIVGDHGADAHGRCRAGRRGDR